MKRIWTSILSVLLIVALVGCSNPQSNENDGDQASDSQFVEYGVAGYITDITPSENNSTLGTILVEGPKDNGAKYDKALVTITPDTKIYFSDLGDFSDLEAKMYVNVFFEDAVRESSPVQADAKQINVIPDDIDNIEDEKE